MSHVNTATLLPDRMVPIGGHKLPPLPYPYTGLEPYISDVSLYIHHDILHKAYVDNLNKAEIALEEARDKNDFEFIQYWENQLAFNGSGHILHSIYWTTMAPEGTGGVPGPETLKHINAYFGNLNHFKEQFIQSAIKVQASGWGILTWQPTWNRLEILQAEKHQDLTQWSGIPILIVDVWEHAYYLDYQSMRPEYVDNWWKIINWNEVEERLMLARDGIVPMVMLDTQKIT